MKYGVKCWCEGTKHCPAFQAFLCLLAVAAAQSASVPATGGYASAYAYENIDRLGYGDAYNVEYSVKGSDYKGAPLDWNAR